MQSSCGPGEGAWECGLPSCAGLSTQPTAVGDMVLLAADSAGPDVRHTAIGGGRVEAADMATSVQFRSVTQSCRLFATPWTAACQASLSITNSQSLLKLRSMELVMPSNHHPLSPLSPSAFHLSQHQSLFQ